MVHCATIKSILTVLESRLRCCFKPYDISYTKLLTYCKTQLKQNTNAPQQHGKIIVNEIYFMSV